jgi:2-polyprenyl-6-hydroxyphenyl methylase/3-demethylubiquinone-9 3-methyltransferase
VPAQIATDEEITFSFGRNWQEFLERYLTPEREQVAIASIQQFLQREDLRGLTFLDIGCGSGLFSFAAFQLSAQRVTSFDVDRFSVMCCERLRERAGNPANWEVTHGSVLDEAFLARLAPADIVYAWGSLHYTGKMWQAIRNAGALVAPRGLFYLSIYNRVEGRTGSEFWLKMKRFYNRVPAPGKRLMEGAYSLRYLFVPNLVRLRNPFTYMRNKKLSRGMDYWTDVRGWLGGYPYEFASTQEIFRFCHGELGMELVNLHSTNTLGANEFLFHRRD